MTKWVCTGSRQPSGGYRRDELAAFGAICDWAFEEGDELITGGCIGFDEFCIEAAHNKGLYVVTLLPITTFFVAMDAVRQYSDEVIETGVGYWRRDALEVDRGDLVLAAPLYERERSSRYSGTWHTWDVAVKQHKDYVLRVTRPHSAPSYKLLGSAYRAEATHA